MVRQDGHDLFLFHYGLVHFLLSDVGLFAGLDGERSVGADFNRFIDLHSAMKEKNDQ